MPQSSTSSPRPTTMRLHQALLSWLLLLLANNALAYQATTPAEIEQQDQPLATRPERPAAELIATVTVPGDATLLRTCAGWEPAIGVMIAWPLEVPVALVAELARDDQLYVLVTEDDQAAARAELLEIGLDPTHFQLVPSTVETCWPRDYGPHMVFDDHDRLTLVDAVYLDTPVGRAAYSGPRNERPLAYFGDYAGDDTSTVGLAALLGWPRADVGAYLTGGNFLVDGFGRAFSTELMRDENLQIMDEPSFRRVVEEATGVSDHVILHDTEDFGIQHIDCWFKPVDAETLLVKRAPAGHPEAAYIDENLARLAQLKTPFGKPYRILRIDTPAFREDRLPAYTNSLILNQKVLVPLFGDADADAAALATWREALPGYRVLGFTYAGWRSFDALHCRTRAVFDPLMLRLTASRYASPELSDRGLALTLDVHDASGAGLVAGASLLHWRRAGEPIWNELVLAPTDRPGQLVARIPLARPGVELEYYFSAMSKSGRRAELPAVGAKGPWHFVSGE